MFLFSIQLPLIYIKPKPKKELNQKSSLWNEIVEIYVDPNFDRALSERKGWKYWETKKRKAEKKKFVVMRKQQCYRQQIFCEIVCNTELLYQGLLIYIKLCSLTPYFSTSFLWVLYFLLLLLLLLFVLRTQKNIIEHHIILV